MAHSRTGWTHRLAAALTAALTAGLLVAVPAPTADAGHGSFPVSQGIYRVPYADGTDITVSGDHHDHNPPNRIDMWAGKGTPIVAAASGEIRAIVDNHGNDPNPGDGQGIDGNPQDDSLEHACSDNDTVAGSCSSYNNYVWIAHPNGEWTKYTHFGTGTISRPPPAGFGWSVGDWIDAGEVLGLENDVGRAGGTHLHFEVGLPNDPDDPQPFCPIGGFMLSSGCNFGVNLVPLVCDIPNNLYETGETYTANPCNHQPPTADAGGDYATSEGAPIVLDGTGSIDPDGNPLTYRWEPEELFVDPSLEQPTFLAGDNMIVFVELTVYDQIEALWDSDSAMVVVSNVPPTVTIDPGQVTEIDEGGTVTVMAEFTDPGFLDTHTATIDWGVPAGHEGIELAPPSIQIIDPGDPGPIRGLVTGTYQYGDNDDGTGFTIAVTVTDDDGGWNSDGFPLTVDNVDPAVAIDPSGTVLLDGVPTVVANAGEDVGFASHTLDPGSDDLTLAWDWDDGTTDSRESRVNPPNLDPLPSPTVQSRSEPDQATHAFAEACLYEVTFSATDDDGGVGAATVDVVVAGHADQARGHGYWRAEYRGTKNADFTPQALQCFLDIVNHASAVFSDHRTLASLDDAVDILWTRGSSSADDLLDAQLLAAWLNFANGAYALDELVDADGDGVADTAYLDVLVEAEILRVDPARTRPDLLTAQDVLERLNTAG